MTRRKASFSGLVVAVASLLAAVPAAWSQQVVKLGEGETLTISGFVNATLFHDPGSFACGFSNRHTAELAPVAPPPPAPRVLVVGYPDTPSTLRVSATPTR